MRKPFPDIHTQMLSKFLKKRRDSRSPTASVPPGQRVYAIGDVHGRLDLLDQLLTQIALDDATRQPAETTVILLGDLVDRGPDSAGVLERLAVPPANTLPKNFRTRLLMGNHEELFLKAIADDERALRMFCQVGGRETVLSYGVAAQDYEGMEFHEVARRLDELVPPHHRALVAGFEDAIVIGDYLFVHAGIRPGVPLEQQKVADLRWIRDPFLEYRGSHGRMVVHGHTITTEVDRRPNRIGIDTGAYLTGTLTALALEETSIWTLNT